MKSENKQIENKNKEMAGTQCVEGVVGNCFPSIPDFPISSTVSEICNIIRSIRKLEYIKNEDGSATLTIILEPYKINRGLN